MNSEGISGKSESYKCAMKVYKIRITLSQRNGIWYSKKTGQEFYAVLATKLNKVPVFRLIEINEDRSYLVSKPLILEVYPIDCVVIEEFVIKSNQSIKHLRM